ncbi:MAG: serine hydrolase [Calditrichaceae bacterium]
MKSYISISKIFVVFSFILLVLPDYNFGQDKTVEIDKLMQLYNEYGQFNGTVLVAENGKIILQKGYGLANMEWNIPNAPDTKMRLGSITKQFTSMIIMQLVEEGKIKLDAKMTEYLPEYRKDTGDKVTIHHLLTHTSGIPSYTGLPSFTSDISRTPFPVDEFVEKFCSGDLEFEPGTQYKYNNSGYYLLGAIIEKVIGKTYETALHERILDPLGMDDSGYDHHGPINIHRATGYEKRLNGYINSPYLDMSLPYAAGAMYSTVLDLYKWDQALYTDELLSNENKKIMFTPFLNNYAYGWSVRKMGLAESEDSLTVISHGGGINGFNTLISRLLDDKHLVVLLNNTGGTELARMNTAIVNILYEKPYDLPRKSIANVFYKTLSENDITTAVKQYHDLKRNSPDDYNFNEREFNRLGYILLSMNKVSDAIEVFKLNVESYPEGYNTYDSLGEAYMINGQKELAIKNYKKSLELNPQNTNAVEMLKKLNEDK